MEGRRQVITEGGTDRTLWDRSPAQWILANGKTPPALPTSENLNQYVEDYDEPRTKLEAFFSILLGLFDRFFKQRPVGLYIEGHRGLTFCTITRDGEFSGVGSLGGLEHHQ